VAGLIEQHVAVNTHSQVQTQFIKNLKEHIGSLEEHAKTQVTVRTLLALLVLKVHTKVHTKVQILTRRWCGRRRS